MLFLIFYSRVVFLKTYINNNEMNATVAAIDQVVLRGCSISAALNLSAVTCSM